MLHKAFQQVMYSGHELLDNNVQIGLILFKPNIILLFKGNNNKYVLLTFHFSLTWIEIFSLLTIS